ncbi:MAG TPA: hypothetical protein VK137_02775 [Planctomycetaceae bacterium]|nr:hypothetical protein [Planctomycetaceae bacterium]
MPTPLLDREEYIEQAHFFRVFGERLRENISSQEILATVQEEILSTTKLPMAIDFLRSEIVLTGCMSDAMVRLEHYFAPFQAFIVKQAEQDQKSRFDQFMALEILQKEAEHRANHPTPQGLFIFQFECLARNRLGYNDGLLAIASDPMYDESWRDWFTLLRRELGTSDFADLLYLRSEYFVEDRRRTTRDDKFNVSYPLLFGVREGRIAKAHRQKEPLYMFAALQRQLGYPAVPRFKPKSEQPVIHPVLEQRLQRIEQSIKLLQSELKGGLDLSQFFKKPEDEK